MALLNNSTLAAPARRTWRKLHLAIDERHQVLASGYKLRSHVELAMQRYKRIFANTVKARALPRQKTEAGMPISVNV